MFSSSSSSVPLQSHLILNLDQSLRQVLQQPNRDDLHRCFLLLRQCHEHRLKEANVMIDDQLYVPAILLLRQFPRFQDPTLFDDLLKEFIQFFQLIPICSKKILDDLLCMISLILSKKILHSQDEVQQDLFIRFFRAFLQASKVHSQFFYGEFLGDINRNLPILGHLLSSLLQLFERNSSLECRLNIIETLWTLIYTSNRDHQSLVGQILACFLPGILKTLAQDLPSLHQRLIQGNLLLVSFILRITVQRSDKYSGEMKDELRDLVVERNEAWLQIVDTHLAPILQRFSADCTHHESSSVRRALGILMLTILCFSSSALKLSPRLAMKTLLVIISKKNLEQDEMIIRTLLEKLFRLPQTNSPIVPQVKSDYADEFIEEILRSSEWNVSDQVLIECQADLFHLLNEEHLRSSTFTDRRWRLELFIGYYRFIHQHVDFLFIMESFTEKFLKFLFQTLDFQIFLQSYLHLLNHTSSNHFQETRFDPIEYRSIYKHFRPDVEEQIEDLMDLFLRSNETFCDYLFEQINRQSLMDENNRKIFYLISIIFRKKRFDRIDDYRLFLSLLTQLMCDDDKRQRSKKKRKNFPTEPISIRNLTIFFLLQTLRTITRPDHLEYLIDYVPLILLCHSSHYTIVHQTSLFCLSTLSEDLSDFLVHQAETIIDSALRRLHTSSYDGYLILIEFVRLGRNPVINLPIMTHVIEELLLELSCLPSIECIQLTFEFLSVFCQQVIDIVDENKSNRSTKSTIDSSLSLVDLALDLQNQFRPTNDAADRVEDHADDDEEKKKKEKHPWHQMLVSIVDVFQHFISSRDAQIRSYVLDAFPSLARVLSTIDENLFLPLVHKLWPGLVHRLHDQDFNIRTRCLTTVHCLSQLCSDFIDRRIQQDILPLLMQQLDRYRHISSSHSLEYRYLKNLLNQLGSILNVITLSFDQIEEIILILFQYLQHELLAPLAGEQLLLLSKKYADEIWLKLLLHDENEDRPSAFPQMKVYKPQPRLTLDPKWKSTLIDCLNRC